MNTRNLSLGSKITVTLGILAAIVLGFGAANVKGRLAYRTSIRSGLASNQIADHLVKSTSVAAVERGLTSLLISIGGDPLSEQASSLRKKITEVREKTDAEYQLGYAMAQTLLREHPGIGHLDHMLASVAKARAEFEPFRQLVDAGRYPPADRWVETATRYIDAQSDLRLASIIAMTPVEEAIETNLRLKQLVWEAAEYAGRERATIAKLIGEQEVLSPPTEAKLIGWRFTVEKSFRGLKSYAEDPQLPAEIRASIDGATSAYFGQYESVRKRVFASSATGKYPINGEAWIKEATLAINSILAINSVLSQHQSQGLDRAYAEANRELVFTGLAALLAILICAGAAYWFQFSIIPRIVETIQSLRGGARHVSEGSRQIASGAETQAHSMTQQASSLAETAASVEELSSMIKRNSESAEKAKHVVNQSATSACEGQEAATRMSQAVEAIGQSYGAILSQVDKSNAEIGEIVKVIKQISEKTKVIHEIVFQTKLLSFNASVEAARAGEHGKGFAVVAEEVGNLARMSGTAAKEISDILAGSVEQVDAIVGRMKTGIEDVTSSGKQKVEAGSELAARCKDLLVVISDSASCASQMSDQIASASSEQAKGTEEINKAVAQLDQVTQENAAGSEEAARSAEDLSKQAESLNRAIASLTLLILGGRAPRPLAAPAPAPRSDDLQPEKLAPVIPIRREATTDESTAADSLAGDYPARATGTDSGQPPSRDDPRF